MPNIFEYTNFREYLKDKFEELKRENPKFSHRHLAKKLDLATPNLIWLVIQGKRNLTQPVRRKLSKVLGHSKKEALYFYTLVDFLQARTHEEKEEFFSEIIKKRRSLKVARIEERQYEYYGKWYNPVVRELVTNPKFNGNYEILGRRVSPPITEAQARRSVELLENLGLIKKKGKKYIQTDPLVSTGPEVNSLAVVNFHKKTCQLAEESFDRHSLKERTITSCTVNISQENFNDLKGEIADLRKKILSLAKNSSSDTRVYQVNLQLFPLSKIY
jgi:uncharacterized protein (TIGR02147 family)